MYKQIRFHGFVVLLLLLLFLLLFIIIIKYTYIVHYLKHA